MVYYKLEAVSPQGNMYRGYEISLERGLFGTWVVSCCWGSLHDGKGGERKRIFEDQASAERFLAGVLKKRLSSGKRIGIDYRIVAMRKS